MTVRVDEAGERFGKHRGGNRVYGGKFGDFKGLSLNVFVCYLV